MTHEWSLIPFTILTQMAVGAFLLLGAIHFSIQRKAGPLLADRMSDRALLAIGPVLLAAFIISLFHLGDPLNVLHIWNNLGSSWLSREGVAAVFTYLPTALFAVLAFTASPTNAAALAVGVMGLIGCAATVWCTAMIYASLKPVHAWCNGFVPAVYLVLGLMTGGLILHLVLLAFSEPSPALGLGLLAALVAAWALKWAYWRRIDGSASASDTTTAGDDATSSTDGTGTTSSDGTTSSEVTTTSSETASSLAGEPFDGFVDDGEVLAVMGVAHDDVLNVRAGPGTDQEIVATAAPTADDIVGMGRARLLPSSIWYEVTVDGTTGWVNSSLVAFAGGTDDATSEFGELIAAETMTDLGLAVAEGFASTDPASRIVMSVAPTVGDLGEVTYDVIGIGDDAVAGYRLHVFGAEDESGDAFGLKSIERTTFCSRGLSGGLCA